MEYRSRIEQLDTRLLCQYPHGQANKEEDGGQRDRVGNLLHDCTSVSAGYRARMRMERGPFFVWRTTLFGSACSLIGQLSGSDRPLYT